MKKLKKKILFKYYETLLNEYRKIDIEEIKKELAKKIIEVEEKLRLKRTKICRNCGSLELIYRVNKKYSINICKNCGYTFFIKWRRD